MFDVQSGKSYLFANIASQIARLITVNGKPFNVIITVDGGRGNNIGQSNTLTIRGDAYVIKKYANDREKRRTIISRDVFTKAKLGLSYKYVAKYVNSSSVSSKRKAPLTDEVQDVTEQMRAQEKEKCARAEQNTIVLDGAGSNSNSAKRRKVTLWPQLDKLKVGDYVEFSRGKYWTRRGVISDMYGNDNMVKINTGPNPGNHNYYVVKTSEIKGKKGWGIDQIRKIDPRTTTTTTTTTSASTGAIDPKLSGFKKGDYVEYSRSWSRRGHINRVFQDMVVIRNEDDVTEYCFVNEHTKLIENEHNIDQICKINLPTTTTTTSASTGSTGATPTTPASAPHMGPLIEKILRSGRYYWGHCSMYAVVTSDGEHSGKVCTANINTQQVYDPPARDLNYAFVSREKVKEFLETLRECRVYKGGVGSYTKGTPLAVSACVFEGIVFYDTLKIHVEKKVHFPLECDGDCLACFLNDQKRFIQNRQNILADPHIFFLLQVQQGKKCCYLLKTSVANGGYKMMVRPDFSNISYYEDSVFTARKYVWHNASTNLKDDLEDATEEFGGSVKNAIEHFKNVKESTRIVRVLSNDSKKWFANVHVGKRGDFNELY